MKNDAENRLKPTNTIIPLNGQVKNSNMAPIPNVNVVKKAKM